MDLKEIIEQYRLEKDFYKKFTNRIEILLSELIKVRQIEIHSISSRAKLIESLEKKLIMKSTSDCNRYKKLSDITDLAGIRIITYYEKETSDIEKLIKEEFEVDLFNSVDKGVNLDPDRFGYLSKHFIVKLIKRRSELPEFSQFRELFAEIQVRTILQHAWAENEHNLGYKNASGIPRQIKRRFARIAGLLEIADDEFSQIRDKLFEYEKDVKERIAQQDKNLLLDRISLIAFINKDSIIKTLDQAVVPNNCRFQNPSNSEIDNRVEELLFNGIQSIGGLENAIFKYKENIVKFAKKWIKDRSDSKVFSYGISLFYLCYVILAEKKNNELTLEYFKRCHIGLDYEWIETAKRIAQVYEEIVS